MSSGVGVSSSEERAAATPEKGNPGRRGADLVGPSGGDGMISAVPRRQGWNALKQPLGWSNTVLGIAYALGVFSAVVITAIAYCGYSALQPETGPVLFENFTDREDGPVSVADSGQTWVKTTSGSSDAELQVIDGKLTNLAASETTAVGSISIDLPNAVRKITADFGFRKRETEYGSVALVVRTDAPPGDSSLTEHLTSPCHIVVTATKIEFGVANNGQIATIGSEEFGNRLADGQTYTINAEINYDKGIVRIDGPDDRTRVYADSRITSNRGTIVSYDVYQQTAATDDRPYFTQLQAW